ncbi:MAG: cyclic pyranopterin monophosphate synthase MoaC [Bacteroidota bacterium]|nr:cyclic pyranopterin monophosphate synthase MoaC [Bacteroidota bacterium]
MKKFTHTDNEGKAKMVDVGHKPEQLRTAIAEGFIKLDSETVKLIKENNIKKGDVLTVSEIAGIQAAKKASDFIPLCHQLRLTKIDVKTELKENGVLAKSKVKCIGQTGVEMEALTAVSITLLTIYDMCKAIDKKMEIENIRLIEKIKENI